MVGLGLGLVWYLLECFSKRFDKHPCQFHIGVPSMSEHPQEAKEVSVTGADYLLDRF